MGPPLHPRSPLLATHTSTILSLWVFCGPIDKRRLYSASLGWVHCYNPQGLPLTCDASALLCTVWAWLVNQPLIHSVPSPLPLLSPWKCKCPWKNRSHVERSCLLPSSLRAALTQPVLGARAGLGITVTRSSFSRSLGESKFYFLKTDLSQS